MVTLTAFGPWSPASASYETFEPSARVRKPLELMPVWCTKRSLPPSSGVMKPKPLSSLNHLTMPVAMMLNKPSTGSCCAARGGLPEGNDCGAGTAFTEHLLDLDAANATNSGGESDSLLDVAPALERHADHRAGRSVGRHVGDDAECPVGKG